MKCSYDSKSNKATYALYKYNGGGIPKKLDDNDLIVNVPTNIDNRGMIEEEDRIVKNVGGGISYGFQQRQKDGSFKIIYKTIIPGR